LLKRVVKEAISGVALIASFFGLLAVFYFRIPSYDNFTAILTIIFIVATLVSMAALVTFSKTGWSVSGSKNEWGAATVFIPSERLFLGRNPNEEIMIGELTNQKREDEYYDKRAK
jgi:hypothetical protein